MCYLFFNDYVSLDPSDICHANLHSLITATCNGVDFVLLSAANGKKRVPKNVVKIVHILYYFINVNFCSFWHI